MRRRTQRRLLVLLGVAVLVLLAVTREERGARPAEPSPVLLGALSPSPEPSPSAAETAGAVPTPTPAPTPANLLSLQQLRIAVGLPLGYRQASHFNLDPRFGGTFTLTRAAEDRERAYLALLDDLRGQGVGTEAPAFAPGETITISRVAYPSVEEGESALARGKEPVRTAGGLVGTRYRRIEGVQTYDSTHLRLPSGGAVTIQMTYSADDPPFDEEAYQSVLDSITALGAGP